MARAGIPISSALSNKVEMEENPSRIEYCVWT